MTDAAHLLTSLAQALSTMILYADGHPARERALDRAWERLQRLLESDPAPQFSFVGSDVIYGARAMRELAEWDWGTRLAGVGIQRIEFATANTREELEDFLLDAFARLTMGQLDTTVARQERRSSLRWGAIRVEGQEDAPAPVQASIRVAAVGFNLSDEADAIRWMHEEVERRGELPLMEAETVVRSLSLAMHSDQEMLIPLLQLKEYDQYTTTHSLNVSVLCMALAEFMGLSAVDVRAFGVAGLLHDIGKVRIPREILNKPGKLDEGELQVMRKHPVDGAKIIIESDRRLDLASVVAYEHHIMLNGGGYPGLKFRRPTHQASKLVHVCDVYDALRTNRPYREAWDADRVLAHIEKGSGPDFDPDVVRAFTAMIRQWEKRVTVVESESQVFGARPAVATPRATPIIAPA
ncbi:MAG: HD domain-containing protein [Gemmatimonadaceae bacterium]|jgi:putative nucleotidyltransferase with HDIG domain|nr:HD domain-containing protein [Gemmatimonadaceae bacterium]